MSQWREVTLKEIGELARGKSKHRPRYDPILYGGKYPFIQTGDIKNANRTITKYEQTYNEVGLAQSRLWPKGTLCITIAANIAETAILGIDACFPDSVVGFIPDKDKCNVHYIYYYLQWYKKNIQQLAYGTVQDNINLKTFDNVKILLPPLEIQESIASILGSLDDKIELNLKMNETLEEMAMTLYKHWFVDFGPFQDGEFVESELGMIPKGWSICELEEIVEKINERVKAGEHLFSLPYVPIDVLNQKSLMINGYKHGSEAKSSLVKFYKGDILFGAMRPYFHKVCIAPFDGITRTTCFVLRPKNNDYYAFVVATIFREETIDYANSHSKGSTIPYADWETLSKMKVILPPLQYLKEYNEKVVPLFKLMIQNFLNNEELVKTRDYLLPRLLSGEIDLSKAEKQVEKVL